MRASLVSLKNREDLVNGFPMFLAKETPNHLLIHCQLAMRVWMAVLNRFAVNWVMPRIVSELFHQWRITGSLKCQKVLWNLSLIAGCWKLMAGKK